ncbi:MAG: KH domain-containing protein [Clostridia bacterium]|nr:KH domain-containing protein [Clostridia bacterium]
MKEFLETIVRQLVNNPDEVRVEEEDTERGLRLILSVAQEDMGKVIGRDGKVAKALRTVIKAASRNYPKPVYVDIV